MTASTASSDLIPKVSRPAIAVSPSPPALGGPVLIGDVATPAGGQTLLALLLKAGRKSTDDE